MKIKTYLTQSLMWKMIEKKTEWFIKTIKNEEF